MHWDSAVQRVYLQESRNIMHLRSLISCNRTGIRASSRLLSVCGGCSLPPPPSSTYYRCESCKNLQSGSASQLARPTNHPANQSSTITRVLKWRLAADQCRVLCFGPSPTITKRPSSSLLLQGPSDSSDSLLLLLLFPWYPSLGIEPRLLLSLRGGRNGMRACAQSP